MKKHPTKFPGYYVTESGEVYRDAMRSNESGLIRVGEHLRGGDIGNKRNYPSVNISLKENGKTVKQIRYYVHRLIAETFIDNPHGYTEIDHINRDKCDNRVDNLRWCDRKMNLANI
jgi:hypothetical protein